MVFQRILKDKESLPAGRVMPTQGSVMWLLDEAAGSFLGDSKCLLQQLLRWVPHLLKANSRLGTHNSSACCLQLKKIIEDLTIFTLGEADIFLLISNTVNLSDKNIKMNFFLRLFVRLVKQNFILCAKNFFEVYPSVKFPGL